MYTQKQTINPLFIVLGLILLLGLIFFFLSFTTSNEVRGPGIPTDDPDSNNENILPQNPVATSTPVPPNSMNLTVYIQDKEAARTRDCGITQRVTYQVPRTSAVADTSLRILFNGELAQYGRYDSVSVSNGVARVMLTSENTPSGNPIQSLTSCESRHLMSVLSDTLTQYPTINSVELFSPRGRIEF